MAFTFKDLSSVAKLHYDCLPHALKAQATQFFDALDLDGDGFVTLPELLNSNLEEKFGEEFIREAFCSIDAEKKGYLEFPESLAIYYLCMYSARFCEGYRCERNIPQGLGYTCVKCWKEGISSRNGQPFSLCLECFSLSNYQHGHDPLLLTHDFVLFDNLLRNKESSSPSAPLQIAPVRAVEQTLKQCIVCGDYHESKASGFGCDVHMVKMRDSTEFVCEWCFSYLCSKCGNLFRDSTTRAEPGKWLQRFVCPSCNAKNVSTDCYEASLEKLQRMLGRADLLKQCRTCEIKCQNGTLFWIVNDENENMAASSSGFSDPSSQQQQRQSRGPAAHATTRNKSFDNQSWDASNRRRTEEAGHGSSHGHAGRQGRNQSFSGDMASDRDAAEDDDGSITASHSARKGRSFQENAISAVRTVKKVIDVASTAANVVNVISGGVGGGGFGGIGAAASLMNGGAVGFGGIGAAASLMNGGAVGFGGIGAAASLMNGGAVGFGGMGGVGMAPYLMMINEIRARRRAQYAGLLMNGGLGGGGGYGGIDAAAMAASLMNGQGGGGGYGGIGAAAMAANLQMNDLGSGGGGGDGLTDMFDNLGGGNGGLIGADYGGPVLSGGMN